MSFLNPTLLGGLLLAIIPIAVHLLLRAKPKRLIFPALRLIKQQRRQNVRRLQLRHLWLLLLRIAVIVLIVLAVCRPSLPAANYSLTLSEWLTLLSIAALSIGGYLAAMTLWRRRSIPQATLLTRRTMLRGGIGAAALLLALLGVAWPYARRVSAEIKDPAPRSAENVPIAALFLFDTSASMSYKQANKTRLRAGQEMANAYLGLLPAGSKVAVAATGDTTPTAFSTDLVAAQTRINTLEIKSVSQPLNDRLRTLLEVQEEDRRRVTSEQDSVPEDRRQDRFVREIYLFTDLAKSAWRDDVANLLKDECHRLRWIGLYIIDVGEKTPINVSLTDMKLSREAVPAGGSVRIEASVSGSGQVKPEQTVELFLNSGNGPLAKGKKTVTLEAGSQSKVTFDSVDIPIQPFTQGELRLTTSDPLGVDDVVYFTVHNIPALKVLVVAEQPAISRYWNLALKSLNDAGRSAYQFEQATPDQIADRDLKEFDVVCLINASHPSDAVWEKLQTFVQGGGGLAVFLGANSSALADAPRRDRIDPLGYRTPAALSILPAHLEASLPFSPERTLDLRKFQHPLLSRLNDVGALTELGITDVRRYWKVEPVNDASVVTRYTGAGDDETGAPALVERRIGQGRVMMMTTGVDGIAWNDLPSPDNWLFVVFVDQLTQYLAWQGSGTFNHIVGDEVSVPVDRNRKMTKAILRLPDLKQRVVDVPEKSSVIQLRDLNSVGSYTLDSTDAAAKYNLGFSMNLPAAESDLKRLEKSDLDGLLGEQRYSVSENLQDLQRKADTGRLGQEMYSMVVAFLVLVFALEQFTATWFYRTDQT